MPRRGGKNQGGNNNSDNRQGVGNKGSQENKEGGGKQSEREKANNQAPETGGQHHVQYSSRPWHEAKRQIQGLQNQQEKNQTNQPQNPLKRLLEQSGLLHQTQSYVTEGDGDCNNQILNAYASYSQWASVYDIALTTVWKALSEDTIRADFWNLSIHDPKGVSAFTERASQSSLCRVDTSHLRPPIQKDISVAFPKPSDLQSQMQVVPLYHMLIRDMFGNSVYICKRTFRAAPRQPPTVGAGAPAKKIPTLNRCIYFMLREGFNEPGFVAGACISSAMLNKKYASSAEAAFLGMAETYLTCSPAGMTKPFLVLFNSARGYVAGESNKKSKKPDLCMLGEAVGVEGAPLHPATRYVPKNPQKTDSGDKKRYPWLRSLGRTFWDTIMPLPHMKMYKTLNALGDRDFAKPAVWKLVGSLSDIISAYAVHLSDGSIDFVLARSSMIPVDYKASKDGAPSEQRQVQQLQLEQVQPSTEQHSMMQPCDLGDDELEFHDIASGDMFMGGEMGLCDAENNFDDYEEDEEEEEEEEPSHLIPMVDSISSSSFMQSSAFRPTPAAPPAVVRAAAPAAYTAWWGRPVVRGD